MIFHCRVCEVSFKKFVLFEGHFDFNDKCREKHSRFMQCYICMERFRYSAALHYHFQQHTIKRVKKLSPQKPQVVPSIPSIPKITLKKQWNFKVIQPVENVAMCDTLTNSQLECKICHKKFRSIFYLEQHLKLHQKKRLLRTKPKNEERKAKPIVMSVPANGHSKSRVRTNDMVKSGPSNGDCESTVVVDNSAIQAESQSDPSVHTPLKRFKCHICKIKLSYGGERLGKILELFFIFF